MKKLLILACSLLLLILTAGIASAAQIKVYVSEFAITGAANKDDLKTTLQTLLASRLSGDSLLSVDSPAGADVLVKGSYIAFGKIFSIDAVARDAGGRVIARSFQQGESQDELIPAVGKLGQGLATEIAAKAVAAPSTPAQPLRSMPAPVAQDIEKPEQASGGDIVRTPLASDIVKPQDVTRTASGGWLSQRLTGELIAIAPGKLMADGSQDFYLAGDKSLRLYRKSDNLKLLAEVTFGAREKVLGIDSADLDKDGMPEAYVTIMDGESLASQVWVADGNNLKRVAAKLPYYFRGIALEGGERKVYVQQMSSDRDFYGDIFELVKTGNTYEAKNPFKLPRFGHLFNFNRFRDSTGASNWVVINDDGYLIVYSPSGEELWRSSDKFGGSETYFLREDLANVRTTGDPNRWTFLEQRITVTPAGDVIVPKNGGMFVIGNNRAYKKSSIYCFAWNGSSLDEKWHTKQSQNYLPDYFYDHSRRELVNLEIVKKEGLLTGGASMVAVRKVE